MKMKLGIVSDLHIDINKNYPVTEQLSMLVKKEQADVIVLAGDISEQVTLTKETVRQISTLSGAQVYYIPGNHDLWGTDRAANTDQIYQEYEEDEFCLCGKVVRLTENYALVGDTGWYDYSFAGKQFSMKELDQMCYGGRTWQDSIKNDWTKDNISRCEWFLNRFQQQLMRAEGKNIVAVSHMLPVREFTVKDGRKEWEYFNAFLGTKLLSELYEEYPVKYSVCGHVHYRASVQKRGITYYCPCLNYFKEWKSQDPDRLLRELRESVVFLTI